MKTSISKFLVSSLILCLSISVAIAQQAKKISVQGFLKDANGKAVADGSQSITFKLYNVATGGTAAWTDNQTINIFGGVYSAHLGSVANPVDGLNWGSETYFVGVTVQGTELIPRTELTFAPYSLGSPKSQEVVCSGAVGDVKYSILNPTQFAAVNGSCWVPMKGGSIVGSKLATITGMTTIPDAGGLFIRNQEFAGGANQDPSRDSNSPIANFQDHAMQLHGHGFSGTTDSRNATSLSTFKYFYEVYSGDGANLPSGVDGSSMEEGKGNPDKFMRYNTVDLSGNHNHSFSGSTANHNGNSADETRPKNLNLWTYIRIN